MKCAAISEFSGLLLARLATPAIAVALSPIPVVVVLVLLIHNGQPRAASSAYFLGRLTALTTVTVTFIRAPWLRDAVHRPLPPWADSTIITIGALFVAIGVLVWIRRGTASDEPQWHHQIGGISPAVSAAIGLLPALVNPKIIAASIAADTEIAALDSNIGATAALAYFVVLATSTTAAPILFYFAIGPRIDPKLELLRQWIQHRHHAATAMTLVIVGVAILLYGLS